MLEASPASHMSILPSPHLDSRSLTPPPFTVFLPSALSYRRPDTMAIAPPINPLVNGELASAIAVQKATERTAHFLGENVVAKKHDGLKPCLPFTYLPASGTALFAYDWALTFHDEVSQSVCIFVPRFDPPE